MVSCKYTVYWQSSSSSEYHSQQFNILLIGQMMIEQSGEEEKTIPLNTVVLLRIIWYYCNSHSFAFRIFSLACPFTLLFHYYSTVHSTSSMQSVPNEQIINRHKIYISTSRAREGNKKCVCCGGTSVTMLAIFYASRIPVPGLHYINLPKKTEVMMAPNQIILLWFE